MSRRNEQSIEVLDPCELHSAYDTLTFHSQLILYFHILICDQLLRWDISHSE